MKKRRSNRKYPPLKCLQCLNVFTPHDGRQKFCCDQCRTDNNNDNRRERDQPLREMQKQIKNNERVLICALANHSVQVNGNLISMDILQTSGYRPLTFRLREINPKTGQPVHWQLNHGIESIDPIRNIFKILKNKQ